MAWLKKGAQSGGLGRGVAAADDDGGDDTVTLTRPVEGDLSPGALPSEVAPPPVSSSVYDEVRPVSKKERAAMEKTARAEAKAAAKAQKGSSKVRRGKRSDVVPEGTDERLSVRVLMEFYPGLTKADAIETARSWAQNHFTNPNNCFYYVQEVPGGFGIEVQEGVGRAYLPSVVDQCMANPGSVVLVPMVRRTMTVAFSPGSGEFEAHVLAEGADPPVFDKKLVAKRGPVMTPITKQYINTLIAGIATFGLGAVSLLASILFYALDPSTRIPPEWKTTETAQLPVLQWDKLQADATDSYVVRLEYVGDSWRVVRQSATADVAQLPVDSAVAPGDPAASGNASGAPVPGAITPPDGAAAGAPSASPPAGSVPPIQPPGASGASAGPLAPPAPL